ncbi:MAG: spermidine synthase [Gemmatimonadota bacterium]
MKPVERLAEAIAPDGSALTLYRHDGDYGIRAGGTELMSTRRHHSEEQLATRVCLSLRDAPPPGVLIGGLGFGYTLAAALRVLPADAKVVVAELIPEIIEWNLHPDYPLARPLLADPRVELRNVDVADVLSSSRRSFDAILMDVDNGPEALTTERNAALYGTRGVRMTVDALRPRGRLAYWSAGDDKRFTATLRAAGLEVEEVRVRAHRTSGGRHTLLIGRRSAR